MRNTRKKIKTSKIDKLVVLVLITTIIVLVVSISKYNTTKAGESNAKIAIPILNFNENTKAWNITVSPNMNTETYIFGVSNNIDKKISEVTMQYQILVETKNNLPLEIALYNTYDNETKRK